MLTRQKPIVWPAWVAGMLVGFMIGTAAALLSAPGAGEETRERLWETSIDWRDRTEEAAEEIFQQVSVSGANNLSLFQARTESVWTSLTGWWLG